MDILDFELAELVHDICECQALFATKRDVRLLVDIARGVPPHLTGDRGRLSQIIENLIGNSVKFTSSGEISLNIKLLEQNSLGARLRFEVVDSGMGISKKDLERLFQGYSQATPSISRQFGGTGLGLMISKQLVKLMGGTIGATSELGKGSIFWFEITLKEGVSSQQVLTLQKSSPTELRLVGSPQRILLVDDEPMNQLVAEIMLKELGYQADAVESGRAALEALRQHSYDLVLMDCQMPEMNGYETTKIIRTTSPDSYRDIVIIAMTASAIRGDREKCLESGMTDYLSKPVKLNELGKMLETFLAPKKGKL